MTETVQAWHFVGDLLRDGRPIPADGEMLEHEGGIVMCQSGLHASTRLIDALNYAPGNVLCRVECSGTILQDDDKIVASCRVILWRIDAEDLLRRFARQCALDVAHLWDMPSIVREYLKTGDETKRDAAEDAAGVATGSAAWAAAWGSARAAAGDAAWASARAAARDAAWAAQNDKLTAMVTEAREAP